MLAGRLSDKMSSELGLLLKCNKPSIFFGETIINILLFLKKEKRSNNEICFFVLSELAPNELKQFKLDIQEAFQKGF